MHFDRVAACCGVLLIAALLAAPNYAADRGEPNAGHPFALPGSLRDANVPVAEPQWDDSLAADMPSESSSRRTKLIHRDAVRLRPLTAPQNARPVPTPKQEADLVLTGPSGGMARQRGGTATQPVPQPLKLRGPKVLDARQYPPQVTPPRVMSPTRHMITAGTNASSGSAVRPAVGNSSQLPMSGRVRLVADEQSVLVPIKTEPIDENIDLQGDQGLVTLIATDAQLRSVLRLIAEHHRLNLVLGPEVQGPVTVSIRGARLEEVLDAILGVAGFAWHRVDNLLYVTGAEVAGMDPRVQGRSVRVYQLDYVAAADVQQVANGLLSPVGNAFISESDPADELKTRETLIVEDTPSAHQRIAEYIAQVDVPPMQVLIEAHVMQIALGEEERHGIDLEALSRVDGSTITLDGSNFTDPSGNEATFSLRIDGRDLDGVVELIRRNTNSRTLASPKVSVVNRQEAKIQIGQRLPYSVATTTQTTTVQSVEFLEVGIVLTVRPVVTDDGNVLMYVLPKVSGGKITQNGFPEEETTEVQTTIMIPDGGGIVIGGLIREENVHANAVVPYINKVPVLGHLFKRRSDEIRRNELVVALVAHVIHAGHGPRTKELMDLDETLPDYAASELMHR